MMTRAQNETCDVIAAAAAAAAAELGLNQNQNGDVTPASSAIRRQEALVSPPPSHGHRSGDVRRTLSDGTAARHSRYLSTARTAAGALAHLGGRLDHDAVHGRRWLSGRMRNGPHGRVTAAPIEEERSAGVVASLVADAGSGGGGHSVPLNLTCQAAERRSTTATPRLTNADDDSGRNGADTDRDDRTATREWRDTTSAGSAPVNCVGVDRRRSVSARSDSEQQAPKVRRRTCWSVDNISDGLKSHRTLAKPAYHDDLVLQRRRRSYPSPAVNRHATAGHQTPAANSADFLDYGNDAVTATPTTSSAGHSSSSVLGGQEHVFGLQQEPVPDRLLVDAAWSRVHPPGHDSDLRHSGGGGWEAAARECSVVAQEPGAADVDDHDDDALRQLLRLIQQPGGQPVFLCRHCDIVYADRMLYALHMGLHNVNNPWQCNICGATCSGRQQFALHALHY